MKCVTFVLKIGSIANLFVLELGKQPRKTLSGQAKIFYESINTPKIVVVVIVWNLVQELLHYVHACC